MKFRFSPQARRVLAIAGLLPFLAASPAAADGKNKVSGEVGVEGRFFFRNPLFADQQRASVSLFGEVGKIEMAVAVDQHAAAGLSASTWRGNTPSGGGNEIPGASRLSGPSAAKSRASSFTPS